MQPELERPAAIEPVLASLELTVEEARQIYGFENERHQSIETKATIILAIIGIVFANSFDLWTIYGIRSWPSFAGLVGALLCSLWIVRPTRYFLPHKPIDDFFEYAKLPERECLEQFLLNYTKATLLATKTSDAKVRWLWASFALLGASGIWVVVLAVVP